MPSLDPPLIGHLYDALDTEFGIVVETENPERLRQKLYPLRKSGPLFEPLAFVLSPINPTHLWILKRPSDAQEP